jgi:predicted kinase
VTYPELFRKWLLGTGRILTHCSLRYRVNMEVIIFIGIQGSGKTSFYRERFFDTHIRISLDMLRTRHRERLLIEACIAAKQSFVVDNTNVLQQERAKYIAPAKSFNFRVVGYYFQSQVEAALNRNRQRVGKECVPEKAILGTYKKLEMPSVQEGSDELHYVCLGDENRFLVKEWSDEV